MYTISTAGLNLIKSFEALRLTAYRCEAGKLTIGYGHTGKDVYEGMTITKQQAEELLAKDVRNFELDVMSLVGTNLKQCQFDMLVSFAFNVGSDIDADLDAEGLGDSTLLKLVNKNPNDPAIRGEFAKWNKVRKNGVLTISNGLTKRRAAEANFYFS